MTLITLIIGLPASGKSRLAATMSGYVIDDPTSLSEVIGLDHPHIIIAHYALCKSDTRAKATQILSDAYSGAVIEELFFANDPEQCLRNAARRPDKPVDNLIRDLSRMYDPPRDDFPVWHP